MKLGQFGGQPSHHDSGPAAGEHRRSKRSGVRGGSHRPTQLRRRRNHLDTARAEGDQLEPKAIQLERQRADSRDSKNRYRLLIRLLFDFYLWSEATT